MQSIEDVIDGALYMASLGYHVFPLLNKLKNSKNVRGTPVGWNHNKPENKKSIPSTLNLDEIKKWAEIHKDLIGYGVNPRNRRAIILDVDVKDGKTGAESLKSLISSFGLSLNTFCVKTASGGLHLYYSYDGVPDGFYVKGLANGIEGYPYVDLRTDNNFVNGPFKNGTYKIVKDLPLNPLPDSLITQLPIQPIANASSIIIEEEAITDYKDSTLKGIIPKVIEKGERDNTLIRLIGSWARKYPIDTTIALVETALGRCEGEKLNIEEYIPKVESTYEKAAFRPLKPDMLEWMEDHLILIPERRSVYSLHEQSHHALMLKDAAIDKYKNWIFHVDPPAESKSTRKTKVYSFNAWMESSNRQTLRSFGYYPKQNRIVYCETQGCDVANTYAPPFTEFTPNDKDYSNYVDKYVEFCNMMFGSDADWMLDWAAHQVQHPDKKLRIAPVMVSKARGVGKNLFYDILKNAVGPWNTTEADVTEVVDKHCEFALKHHLVLINEANIDSRDKRAINQRRDILEKLKSKISENMQTVEPKYIGRFNITTFINYIVATNNADAIPMESEDVRFFIVKILAKKQVRSYYNMLWELAKPRTFDKEMPHKVYAIRQYLLNREITRVQVGDIAEFTEAKQEMIDANKSAEQIQIDEDIRNRSSIFRGNLITRELFIWYIDNKMPRGNRLSNGAINDLFRIYFEPVRLQKNQNRAKQTLLNVPERSVDGIVMQESAKKCGIYTCRYHGKYDEGKGDLAFLKAEYNKSLDATKIGFQESESSPESKAK